tara:strand:- start:83 stop:2800 length:2718 start_codon:yes stop_codon:yes gene_type:complete
MTNLADLLPAGGGQNNTDFVADGDISAGAPVILTAAGKAAPISSSSGVVGAAATFESDTTQETAAVYDSNSNKVVVVYRDDGNSYYATSVVGTITGGSTNTVSWGTPVVFASYGCNAFAPVFQSHDNQIVCAFQAFGGGYTSRIQVIAGEVNGTSMDWYSSGAYDPDGSSGVNYISAAYDSNEQKTVLAWVKSSATTESCVVSVSGTGSSANATTGTVVQVNGGGDARNTSCCFDSNSNKMVVLFNKVHDSYKGFGRVGTVSGTSISYGTEAQFMSGKQPLNIGSAFDTSANKVVITGADNANNSQGDCCLGTVSGTDITYSTPVVFSTGDGSGVGNLSRSPMPTIYNPDANKTFVTYFNIGDNYAGEYVEGTVSGSTISFGSATTFEAGVSGQIGANYIGAAYDTNVDRFLVSFVPYATGPYYGQGRVIQVGTSTLTSTNLLGLAPEAISDTATGTINTWGSRCESSSLTTSIEIAESLSSAFLYAQDAPADAVTAAASATGSSNLLMAYYVNDGATQGARVQAATITSGSISYGSSAVIGAASNFVYYYAIANTSSNNKFVVFWQDQSDSYIYGAVVTLTGSSISYGATTAVYSSAAINNYDTFNATYDPDTDRVILGVCDNSDTYAYSVVIEIGSTTIDTVGTPAKIDSSSAANGYAKKIDLCYDTTADKVIATYANVGGGGSYYLRVAAGTVTGGATNSISWGSSSVVYSGDVTYPRCAYNATDQRVVIVYKQASDTKGYSSVATVSGTTVTANTPSVFYDPSSTGGWVLYYTSVAHDSYINKMVIYMRASAGDAVYGAIDTGTNSIAWSSVYNVSADAYNPPQTEFDVGTNQVILLGAGTSKATAESYIYTVPGTVSGQPLTVTSDYYVQTDGTITTDTGGQLIGKAITATQINIKDYTG